MYEKELAQVVEWLSTRGRNPADFVFEMSYLPPESDDGAMFTLRYMIKITCDPTTRTANLVGGNGLNWATDFAQLLADGYFD